MIEENPPNNETQTISSSSSDMELSGLELFAQLVSELSTSTKTNDKLQSLVDYFATAPDDDKVWVIAIFSGRRPRRTVNSRLMRDWCAEITNYPSWLFEECYHTVGDLAETLALLLPETKQSDQINKSLSHYLETFISIEKQDESIRKKFILDSWDQMNHDERFVFNKLITGSFRIGVSQKTIVNALAKTVDLSASVIAHRISGNWDPVTTSFNDLLSESASISDFSKPYPFYLAYALEEEASTLGSPAEWQAEWKWDGIRGQVIKRNNELFVWSRGEELMTDKFPEYFILKDLLPDGVVIDGEIIPAVDGKPLPFAILQTRIGRKNIGKKQLLEAPICFFAYDLLEYNYEDWREKTLAERRNKLESIVSPIKNNAIQISEIIFFTSWNELSELRKNSREMNSEGIMLKRKDSNYKVGRKRGDWWKWKIDPLTIDCVMIYAQKGSGRRSNLYTDYTFAVKDGDKLVSFTKAYSGLTDKEFAQVDNFVKRNSIEKFGPVRTVKPELVFEIAFEGIAASNRHKSGVALRFPRMSRWRKDKTIDEINTIEDLKAMLNMYGK
ncbi:MAG TPA: ATP-dependent DNA ligase [Chitinophagaceae bacterium]|nr:ATP-dependent DNA ligase [Chitinophagaceae bacterium]